MNTQPAIVELKRTGPNGLLVTRTDGTTGTIPSEKLRVNCPCASCREARGDSSHSRPLSASKPTGMLRIVQSTLAEETNLVSIWPVGNYALGVKWGDGHNTGIYSYQYLLELAQS